MNRYPEDPGFEKGSDTSEEAAEAAIPTRAAMQRLVRAVIVGAETNDPPGLTCDQVEVITGGAHQTISARIRDLVLNGSIYDTGDRRLTRRGRKAAVYRIKAVGWPVGAEPYRPVEGVSQERLW